MSAIAAAARIRESRGRAGSRRWKDLSPVEKAVLVAVGSVELALTATAARDLYRLPPALLRGLIFGVDGRALSPTHCVKKGRQYRYYVAQQVLKAQTAEDAGIVRRISAAAIETAVVDQVRALLRQPEVVVGTWLAAQAESPDLTEHETQEALVRLDPLWDELFPAEQARIVRALVDDGVGVAEFVQLTPTLEDLFVQLTGEGFDVSG